MLSNPVGVNLARISVKGPDRYLTRNEDYAAGLRAMAWLLASRASREMIHKLAVRYDGVMDNYFLDGGVYDMWRDNARELHEKMEAIKQKGMHSRKAEWCKLHVKQLEYRQKMEMQRALADVDIAAVLDDWHSLRWRLLWKTMCAYQKQRTFTGPTMKLSRWGLVW